MSKPVNYKDLKEGDWVRPNFDMVSKFVSGTNDKHINSQYEVTGSLNKVVNIYQVKAAAQFTTSGTVKAWPHLMGWWRKPAISWTELSCYITDTLTCERLDEEEVKKMNLVREYLFELDFNYSLNQKCWYPQLEADMVKKAVAAAESHVRISMRAWPFGKRLGFDLRKEKDKISFFWEDNNAVRK